MSIMVTGGTGFIGACIVRELVERGEDVEEELHEALKFMRGNYDYTR